MDYNIIKGKGRYIFFLHGWGGNKDSFAIVKNRIDEINRNMVFVSFSGFDGKDIEMPYTLPDFADELAELIIKIAKGKSVDIVCHSFGARVSFVLFEKYPALVNKIMIVDGAGVKPKRSLDYYLKVYRYKWLKWQVLRGKKDKSVLEKYGSADYKALSTEMKQTFVNVVNFNLNKQIKNITCPCLIFWGGKDTETPLYMAKMMNKWIKSSKLIVSENSGHFSYLDDFDLFFESFKNFVLQT